MVTFFLHLPMVGWSSLLTTNKKLPKSPLVTIGCVLMTIIVSRKWHLGEIPSHCSKLCRLFTGPHTWGGLCPSCEMWKSNWEFKKPKWRMEPLLSDNFVCVIDQWHRPFHPPSLILCVLSRKLPLHKGPKSCPFHGCSKTLVKVLFVVGHWIQLLEVLPY